MYEQALSFRNVTCTCLLFLTMRMYQPGGLTERSELLKGLTNLAVCESAGSAVAILQKWFRHLERARAMLDGVDKCMKNLLQANANLQFRVQNIRMQLQLDTAPTQETVEEYTRTLLAEMELLLVSAPEGSSKRQRVASVNTGGGGSQGCDKGGKGAKGSKPGEANQQAGAGGGRGTKGDARKVCPAWSTEGGCPQGKLCTMAHTPERYGACWVCGGNHQKAECKAPGGGKAPKGEEGLDGRGSKGKKGKARTSEDKSAAKGAQTANPKSNPKAGAPATGISEAAIREAAQILQSLRLASVQVNLRTASEVLNRTEVAARKGLIDGAATACLRTANEAERQLPLIPVKLACGSCNMHINACGTLLSEVPVSPILSVKALLKLGYRLDWNASRCKVYHPKFGELEVDTSTGCPEVDESATLSLIDQYELYVGEKDTKSARLRCIIEDLRERGDGDLIELIASGDSQADAALSVYVSRLFPEVSSDILEQCVVSLQDPFQDAPTWNRRTRRRCMRSQGVVVHAFCGKARKVFENVAHKRDFAHLGVDTAEDLLSDQTYRFLLQQARDGRIRGIVGAPPSRTFSAARYLSETTGQGPRPIRLPGESLGLCGISDLSCQERAQRNVDDVLYLRFMVLLALAVESNRCKGVPDPAKGSPTQHALLKIRAQRLTSVR